MWRKHGRNTWKIVNNMSDGDKSYKNTNREEKRGQSTNVFLGIIWFSRLREVLLSWKPGGEEYNVVCEVGERHTPHKETCQCNALSLEYSCCVLSTEVRLVWLKRKKKVQRSKRWSQQEYRGRSLRTLQVCYCLLLWVRWEATRGTLVLFSFVLIYRVKWNGQIWNEKWKC